MVFKTTNKNNKYLKFLNSILNLLLKILKAGIEYFVRGIRLRERFIFEIKF